jgi:hypothetical protein
MENEQTLADLLIANAAKDAKRYIDQQKFLEDQIKVLIGAIRTAPDLVSLRVVANVVGGAWFLNTEFGLRSRNQH